MAKVLTLSKSKVQIVVAKNIGFLKAAKDVLAGGGELEGVEELYLEAYQEAIREIPVGFQVVSSDIKIIKELNIMILVNAEREESPL